MGSDGSRAKTGTCLTPGLSNRMNAEHRRKRSQGENFIAVLPLTPFSPMLAAKPPTQFDDDDAAVADPGARYSDSGCWSGPSSSIQTLLMFTNSWIPTRLSSRP